LGFLARELRQEQEMKGIQKRKEEVKLFLFADVMNLKTLPKKPVEIINSLSKVAGYKINIWKSVAFLYTNNEQIEKEIREISLLTIASKNNKVPWNKFEERNQRLF
jgi:hypothetical protein